MSDRKQCKCIFCGTEYERGDDGSEKCPTCTEEWGEADVTLVDLPPVRYDPIEDKWKRKGDE